ncbi:MAG TPA: type IV pilus secretin PilQ [Thermodesulfobacteriota bacterium]|nr:type IV pilus secretin PilQ [Thermodesulfobacteriota bacterium]
MRFLLIAIFSVALLLAAPLLTISATSEPLLPGVEEAKSSTLLEQSDYKGSGRPSYVAQAAEPAAPQQPSGVPQFGASGLNKVESIDFNTLDGAGVVSVKTSLPVQYEELPKEERRYSVKLVDVYLSDELQVSRDVKDFDSPVGFVSSFRDPVKESDVIISVELKEDAPVLLQQIGNSINIKLGQTEEEKLAEAKKEEIQVEDKGPLWAFDFRSATVPGTKKVYRGQLVSFDFKDADIRDVLRILADISGFNIIVSSDVKGTVTLKLSNVPWDQALDVVLEDAGLGAFVEGNVVKVAPLKALQQRQTAIQAAAKSKEQLEPLTTRQVFVNYATAEELIPLAEPLLSDRGDIKVDTRTNSLLVTDTGPRVAQIEELVKSLDTRTPQVLIESRIVQATLDFTRELGVQWGFNYRASAATGNPTGAFFPSSIGLGGVTPGNPGPFGQVGDNFVIDLPAAVGTGSGGALGIVLGSITGAYDLDIRLSALENRGDGRVLSSPKVLTLDNQPARIEQGVSIPFLSVSAAGTQTQFVDATLRLEVTPQVTNDGRVLMDIRVTDNAPDPSITGADGQPAIRRNEAETQVLSLDGETIVIGGIFTRTTTENLSGIPWFSRIPLLGFLFRNTQNVDQRRELLVFITPRIIR